MRAGRPIDAVLCFRRAAHANPRDVDARFHLGEVLWQLGLSDEAIAAWRDAAQIDSRFLAARLALAESLLARADYTGAQAAAGEALALAPLELRARASHEAAAAALGDRAALARLVRLLSENPELSLPPAYTPALARVLEHAPRDALREDFVAQLVPRVATLPSAVLALVATEAIAHNPAALTDALRVRAWQRNEIDALRRIIIAVHAHDAALAKELVATHAAMCLAEPLPVPSGWPARTGGAPGRVAWLVPAPDTPLFASACATVEDIARKLGLTGVTTTIVCAGRADLTRAALPVVSSLAEFRELPPHPDATHARALAGSDPDVLVDLAGMHAATGLFLAARPARSVWSLASTVPGHAPALVDQILANADQLAVRLRDLLAAPFPEAPGARELAEWWDAAVRAHQQGDADAAAAGYARVLDAQPDYAPAHRLSAVLARDHGDPADADREFTRAVALAPDDVDTRIAAAQFATASHHVERAAAVLREGVGRAPYSIPLWVALGHAELARRDGDRRRAGVRPGPAFRAGGRAVPLQSWRGVADGRRRGPGGACLPACAGAAAGLRVGMFQSCACSFSSRKEWTLRSRLTSRRCSSIPAMPRHTRIWARSCSPLARSMHGSRIFVPSRRTARTRCPSRCRRWKSASSRATTRSWIPMSRDCGARGFRQATSWG